MAVTSSKRSTLFVLSGGGMPGLDIHAGIRLALAEYGIEPTHVVGTSAGAIVGSLIASGRSSANIAAIISNLEDSDVRKDKLFWKLRLPWLNSFLDNTPIRKLLHQLLPAATADFKVPFDAWATELLTGASTRVTADPNPPAEAVLASMSICGVFPPVKLCDGLEYVDGGVRNNLPLPPDWRNFDEVFILIASQRPTSYRKTSGVLTHLMRNVQYLMLDQIEDVVDLVNGSRSVTVIWPPLPIPGGALRFDHSLIERAHQFASAKLQASGRTRKC